MLKNLTPYVEIRRDEQGIKFTFILYECLLISLISIGVVKGLNQVLKALDTKAANICFIADDCDDPKYIKTVEALAKQNKIPVIHVEERNNLGEWLGQCKYDTDGNARKVKGCSSAVVQDYGEQSDALVFLENYIKQHNC